MFSVRVDESKRRLLVTVEAFLTPEGQVGLTRELKAGALKAKGHAGHFDVLADFSRGEVMSQESTKASVEWVAWCIAHGLRKSANVVSKALLTSQINRVTPDPRFRTFADRKEAEAWLEE